MQTSTSSSTRPSGHDHAVDDLAVAIGRAVTATKSDDECPWSVAQHLAKALAAVVGVDIDQVRTEAYRNVQRGAEPVRLINVGLAVVDVVGRSLDMFATNGTVVASLVEPDSTASTNDLSARELAEAIACWAVEVAS